MFDLKISPKNSPVKGLIFWQFPDCLNFDNSFNVIQIPGGGRGGTLGIFGWGCAAGTLKPLAYTRASLACVAGGIVYQAREIWRRNRCTSRVRVGGGNHTIPPVAQARASLAEFSYPIYTRINSPNPPSLYPRVAVFQKLLTGVISTVQPKQNRFEFFMFLSGNSLFSQSRLKSLNN